MLMFVNIKKLSRIIVLFGSLRLWLVSGWCCYEKMSVKKKRAPRSPLFFNINWPH